MARSYDTLELIACHHAEVERLCDELLDMGSRVGADDPAAYVLREQARALGYRLREHVAIETNAMMADEGADPKVLDAYREERERLERALADAERKQGRPLELVNAVCSIARDARAHLDRAALD